MSSASVDTTHFPSRPAWTCTDCGEAWPCPTRRKELATEYADEPVLVCVLQAGHLMQAVDDLPDVPGDVLYRRFLRDWRQP